MIEEAKVTAIETNATRRTAGKNKFILFPIFSPYKTQLSLEHG
jgi:hypothetical protein